MNFREIPNSNNQKVFIDNSSCNFVSFNLVMCYLSEKGYDVVIDYNLIDDDTFFFSPCIDKKINNTAALFKLKKSRKINEILYKYDIVPPFTADFDIRLFDFIDLPFLIKNENQHGGKGKFLIKNLEQIKKFLKFYNEINEFDKRKRIEEASMYYGVEFDEFGKSASGWTVNIIDFQKNLKDLFVIQEYIKTPTKYNTSLRVLTSVSGDILCSSLKYSDKSSKIKVDDLDIISSYLLDEYSQFFLGSESAISNTIAGGNSILLEKDNYTEEEKKVLLAHNIDPNNPVLPDNIKQAALEVALKCKQELGAICGMDFIYNEEEKKWYFLEEHEFPMLISYTEKFQLPYDFSSKDPIDFYVNCHSADIDARLNSLSMYMEKKGKIKQKK